MKQLEGKKAKQSKNIFPAPAIVQADRFLKANAIHSNTPRMGKKAFTEISAPPAQQNTVGVCIVGVARSFHTAIVHDRIISFFINPLKENGYIPSIFFELHGGETMKTASRATEME